MRKTSRFSLHIAFFAASLLIALLPGSSYAGIVTLAYSGTFTSPGGVLPSGTEFFGEITYDTATLPFSTAGNSGAFAIDSFGLSFLGNDYASLPAVFVQDELPGVSFDRLSANAQTIAGPMLGSASVIQINLALTDQQGVAFSSLKLPESIELDDFLQVGDTHVLTTVWSTPSGIALASGDITSLTISTSAVPEPGSGLLFAGVAALMVIRRKQRRIDSLCSQ